MFPPHDKLKERIPDVSLSDALRETQRELQARIGTERKPGGVYHHIYKQNMTNFVRQRALEAQTVRLMAIEAALTVLEDHEWRRLLKRYETLQQQINGQQQLFNDESF